jgi:hypothetical protein
MAAPDLDRYAREPIAFADEFVRRNEKGVAWRLSRHQRRVLELAFRWSPTGVLLLGILLWSEIKKSGKTFLAAVLGLWWAFTNAHTVVLVAANDFDQAVGRVFATMVALCEHNAQLKASVKVYASEIHLSNGTVIRAVPGDYRGEAGERHSLVIYDELWAYDTERARRLFEELTPPPTEPNAWVLIVTYAGYTGESVLLEEFYARGLAGARLDDALEVTQADDLVMFWSHVARQPWQLGEAGERYYARQRKLLRPNTFLRLHENRWVSAESVFLTPELWDPCVDERHRPSLLVGQQGRGLVYVGVDAGIKHDTAAVVAVRWVDDYLELVTHRIWQPSPGAPIDLEDTIELHLRELHARLPVAQMVCDPYQLHRSITTLQKAGLPIEEYPHAAEPDGGRAGALRPAERSESAALSLGGAAGAGAGHGGDRVAAGLAHREGEDGQEDRRDRGARDGGACGDGWPPRSEDRWDLGTGPRHQPHRAVTGSRGGHRNSVGHPQRGPSAHASRRRRRRAADSVRRDPAGAGPQMGAGRGGVSAHAAHPRVTARGGHHHGDM